jgi:hypothetical protein
MYILLACWELFIFSDFWCSFENKVRDCVLEQRILITSKQKRIAVWLSFCDQIIDEARMVTIVEVIERMVLWWWFFC